MTPTWAMMKPNRRKTMIPQIDSTVGVKTPSNVPSFELSEPEFEAVALRLLFLVGWLWLSEVTPD